MGIERQSPDAILELTNLSGVVSAIQDDPDSPDANWLTSSNNNADTVCRVSFPTPTGNPTVGVGLQQFKIWVKKWNGTGTPTVRIELYENGGLKATILANTNVTSSTGQLFSATWNANLLGTANGSLVECRIYGTKSGGATTARATVLVGAVEWNVTYDEAPEAIVKIIDETMGLSEAETGRYRSSRFAPNILGIGETALRLGYSNRFISETLGIVEGFARRLWSIKFISEVIGFLDTKIHIPIIIKFISGRGKITAS